MGKRMVASHLPMNTRNTYELVRFPPFRERSRFIAISRYSNVNASGNASGDISSIADAGAVSSLRIQLEQFFCVGESEMQELYDHEAEHCMQDMLREFLDFAVHYRIRFLCLF